MLPSKKFETPPRKKKI